MVNTFHPPRCTWALRAHPIRIFQKIKWDKVICPFLKRSLTYCDAIWRIHHLFTSRKLPFFPLDMSQKRDENIIRLTCSMCPLVCQVTNSTWNSGLVSKFTWFRVGKGTVLPNGVKVAVWDLSQIFQKWKKWFYHVLCIHIEWIWSKSEQVNTQSL